MIPMKWAIVGTGDFALDWVLSAARESAVAEPVAIVTRDVADAQSRRPHTAVPFVGDLDEALSLGAEAVHIITPNATHRSIAVAAAQLGMHVLVEKPMAPSLEDAHAIVGAATEAGVGLAVGSCMAWSPVVVAVRGALTDPSFGRVRHIEISAGFDAGEGRGWRHVTPTALGGGVLMDLGAHAVDAAERLVGPVQAVRGMLRSTLRDHRADDRALIMLEHQSGVTSSIDVAFTHACNALTVTGDGGRLVGREWLGRRFAGELHWERGSIDAARSPSTASDDVRLATAMVDVVRCQMDEVSRAFRSGCSAPHAEAAAGLSVVAILEAAIESDRRGGSAVRLVGNHGWGMSDGLSYE